MSFLSILKAPLGRVRPLLDFEQSALSHITLPVLCRDNSEIGQAGTSVLSGEELNVVSNEFGKQDRFSTDDLLQVACSYIG